MALVSLDVATRASGAVLSNTHTYTCTHTPHTCPRTHTHTAHMHAHTTHMCTHTHTHTISLCVSALSLSPLSTSTPVQGNTARISQNVFPAYQRNWPQIFASCLARPTQVWPPQASHGRVNFHMNFHSEFWWVASLSVEWALNLVFLASTRRRTLLAFVSLHVRPAMAATLWPHTAGPANTKRRRTRERKRTISPPGDKYSKKYPYLSLIGKTPFSYVF